MSREKGVSYFVIYLIQVHIRILKKLKTSFFRVPSVPGFAKYEICKVLSGVLVRKGKI